MNKSADSDLKIDTPFRPWVTPGYMSLLAIIVILFSVWMFTREAWIDSFDLSKKGDLGSAISGLTAPVISLISAGLLFYSFKAQREANNLIQTQWQYDNFNSAFKEMQESFNACKLKYLTGIEEQAFGKDAIQVIVQRPQVVHADSKKDFFADMDICLSELNILIMKSKNLEISNGFDLRGKLIRFYRYKLGNLFNLFISELEKNPNEVQPLLKTAKNLRENMKSINYIEFPVQGQDEFYYYYYC